MLHGSREAQASAGRVRGVHERSTVYTDAYVARFIITVTVDIYFFHSTSIYGDTRCHSIPRARGAALSCWGNGIKREPS
jgi:hypothetical protein